MKSIRNSFYKNLTFSNLLYSYNKTKVGKSYVSEVLSFEYNLEINLINLINSIATFNYDAETYKSFIIYEPKKRVIRCLPFIDRVVQTWYVEFFLKPFFVPRFIYDSYACIENKGTHKAIFRLKYFMNKMRNKYNDYYIIKLDISKFFESINKDILFNILSKKINDKYLLKFTYNMIYSYKDKGIPIVNYSSQYFANIYLTELDYYVKFNLKIKYYCRYMDDFIILVKDKSTARNIYCLIERFLFDKLKLKLNPKSKYFPSKEGCSFLGFIIYEDYILLNNKFKKKLYNKIKIWNYMYNKNILDMKSFILSYNSYMGHIKHANSYCLKQNIDKRIYLLNAYKINNLKDIFLKLLIFIYFMI